MFEDREQAGRELAKRLMKYQNQPDTVVLGIARGGVAVGAALAQALNLPLGVAVVRKLGHPEQPEFAIGAVDADGKYILAPGFEDLEPTKAFQNILRREREEAKRRFNLFKEGRLPLRGKKVILADDGIATGQTNLIALKYVQRQGAKEIVIAAPVASLDAVELLKSEGAEMAVLATPANFMAVGQFYDYFPQLTDEAVLAIINLHNRQSQKYGESI